MAKKKKVRRSKQTQSTTQHKTAAEVQVEKSKQKKQQQMLVLGGVVVAGLLLVGAIIFLTRQSAGETLVIGEDETYDGVPLGGEYSTARDITLASDVAEGVERGINAEGIPYIGNPNAAIVIGEFSNYTCPACATYEDTAHEIIKDFARSGDVLFEFYPLTNSPASEIATDAALCAAEQGAFWEMHSEIFRVLQAESSRAFTIERMEDIANDIGIDGSELISCTNTNMPDRAIAYAREKATEIGITGTPSVAYRLAESSSFVMTNRGYDNLADLIQDANAES